MRRFIAGALGALLLAACAADANERTASSTPRPSARSSGCPVTVPPQPAFVPPEPYPSEPPFDDVWYGTLELWTIFDSHGASLISGGDKTLWWSENFSTAEGEDFAGDADITVTGARVDGSAHPVVVEGGVPSFNGGIGNFMLVGLDLPDPGCWRVIARYQGAKLAYVLRVS